MVKLALLNKDGTLVGTRSGSPFPMNAQDQVLLPGAAESLKTLVAQRWEIVLVLNAGAVAAAYREISDMHEEIKYCMGLMNVPISYALFCPDSTGMQCYCVDYVRMLPVILSENDPQTGVKNYTLAPGFMGGNPDGIIGHCWKKTNADGAGMLRIALSRNTYDRTVMIGNKDEDRASARYAGIPHISSEIWRAVTVI